jgi:hypothetical protein
MVTRIHGALAHGLLYPLLSELEILIVFWVFVCIPYIPIFFSIVPLPINFFLVSFPLQ